MQERRQAEKVKASQSVTDWRCAVSFFGRGYIFSATGRATGRKRSSCVAREKRCARSASAPRVGVRSGAQYFILGHSEKKAGTSLQYFNRGCCVRVPRDFRPWVCLPGAPHRTNCDHVSALGAESARLIVQDAVQVKVSATVAPANTRDRSNVKRILKIKIWSNCNRMLPPGQVARSTGQHHGASGGRGENGWPPLPVGINGACARMIPAVTLQRKIV